MSMYMAEGTAHWGEKCARTAIKVAKDKVQSAMERSRAYSRASGRRSPKSINFPSLSFATSGPGMPSRPKMGSTRVRVSLVVGCGGQVEPAAEATNHLGTTGQTPDNVPADRPAPTKTEGCGGQAHVPQPPTPRTRQIKSPLGVNCKVRTRAVVPIRGRGRGKTKATIKN